MDNKPDNDRRRFESFYRYKISTLINSIKEFKLKKEKSGKPYNQIALSDELFKNLNNKIVLHSKYYNKQFISFKHADIALKKLNYSEYQISSIISSVDIDTLSSKYCSQIRPANFMTQTSITEITPKKNAKNVSKVNYKSWKKKKPGKYFIISSEYPQLIEEMVSRGWLAANYDSNYFDFKFVVKIKDVNCSTLNEAQIVNHNPEFEIISCKFQLYNLLKALSNQQCDIEKFYPRCYDLKCYRDHANFMEDYKLSQCLVFLDKFIDNNHLNDILVLKAVIGYTGLLNYINLFVKGTLVDSIIPGDDLDFLCNQNLDLNDYIEYEKKFTLTDRCSRLGIFYKKNADTGLFVYELRKLIMEGLDSIRKIDPQLHLTSQANAWILKPYKASKGKGVKIMTHYKDILKTIIESECDWMVQKYIEKPLTIHNRKVR